jgi:hypothetical protein
MENKLNFKELLKVACNSGLIVISIIAMCSVLYYSFNLLSEIVNATSAPFKPVIGNNLSLFLSYTVDFVLNNLVFITMTWISLYLWIFIMLFYIIEKDNKIPVIIRYMFSLLIFVGSLILIFNIIKFNFFYSVLILLLLLTHDITNNYKENKNMASKKVEYDPQQKFDF